MARPPGIAEICPSVMVRAVLAQGDGRNEGVGTGRRDLLGVGCRVHAHQLGELGGGVGGVRAAERRLVDANVDHWPVRDQRGSPAPRMEARCGVWVARVRISPSARSGTRMAGFHTVSHLSPDFFSCAETVYFHSSAPTFQV